MSQRSSHRLFIASLFALSVAVSVEGARAASLCQSAFLDGQESGVTRVVFNVRDTHAAATSAKWRSTSEEQLQRSLELSTALEQPHSLRIMIVPNRARLNPNPVVHGHQTTVFVAFPVSFDAHLDAHAVRLSHASLVSRGVFEANFEATMTARSTVWVSHIHDRENIGALQELLHHHRPTAPFYRSPRQTVRYQFQVRTLRKKKAVADQLYLLRRAHRAIFADLAVALQFQNPEALKSNTPSSPYGERADWHDEGAYEANAYFAPLRLWLSGLLGAHAQGWFPSDLERAQFIGVTARLLQRSYEQSARTIEQGRGHEAELANRQLLGELQRLIPAY